MNQGKKKVKGDKMSQSRASSSHRNKSKIVETFCYSFYSNKKKSLAKDSFVPSVYSSIQRKKNSEWEQNPGSHTGSDLFSSSSSSTIFRVFFLFFFL